MSETSNSTPGPWKVVLNGNPLCSGIVAVVEHSPGRLLTVEEDHFGGPWCAPATWEGNARLIAAAPDLLAALCGLVKWAESVNDSSSEGGLLGNAFDDALEAIAKAEGR